MPCSTFHSCTLLSHVHGSCHTQMPNDRHRILSKCVGRRELSALLWVAKNRIYLLQRLEFLLCVLQRVKCKRHPSIRLASYRSLFEARQLDSTIKALWPLHITLPHLDSDQDEASEIASSRPSGFLPAAQWDRHDVKISKQVQR